MSTKDMVPSALTLSSDLQQEYNFRENQLQSRNSMWDVFTFLTKPFSNSKSVTGFKKRFGNARRETRSEEGTGREIDPHKAQRKNGMQ